MFSLISRSYSLTVKYAYPDGINMGKGQESRKGPMRLGTKKPWGKGVRKTLEQTGREEYWEKRICGKRSHGDEEGL